MKTAHLALLVILAWPCLPCSPSWADGSIARGDDGRVGLSYNDRGPRVADEAALDKCGGHCRIVDRFRHTCAAIAKTRRGGYGFAVREREGGAQSAAMLNCENENNGCFVFLSGCDD